MALALVAHELIKQTIAARPLSTPRTKAPEGTIAGSGLFRTILFYVPYAGNKLERQLRQHRAACTVCSGRYLHVFH